MHLVDHLSYSSISLMQLCGHAWMRRYFLKERGKSLSYNLVFGSAFHDTIEHSIGFIAAGEDRQKAISGMPDYFIERLIAHIGKQEINWQDMSKEEVEELGTAMFNEPSVRKFVDDYKPLIGNGGKPAIEVDFSIDVPGVPVPITGFIDLIDENGIPCDLKTSGRRWGQWRADKELQATIYLEAMKQMGAKRNPNLAFEYAVFVKKVPTPVERITTFRTEEQLGAARELIASLWNDSIVKDSFPKTGIGTWKCTPDYCDYYEKCLGGKDD